MLYGPLGVDEIMTEMGSTLELLASINKEVHVVFTVSPVRHWKDGPGEAFVKIFQAYFF
jgi:hypothetical protein